MASFNKVIIIGNISSEVELKQTQTGTSVCSFNVAVNRYSKAPNEAKADFFTVCAWQAKAEFVSRYFSKGKPILVCGRLENRSWTDKNGNNRISTEIIAEEVSFVASAPQQSTAPTPAPQSSVPNPAQWGNPNYTPAAYTQPSFNASTPQFEEIPSDESLPF